MATPYSPSTSLLSPGRIGQAAWVKAIAAHNPGEAAAIVATYHVEAGKLGLNPDIALAQAIVEASWFTSDLWRTRRNPCGLGITGPGVLGKDYGADSTGIRAHLDHLCCYAYPAATCPVPHALTNDDRHLFHDGNPRLSHLQEPPPGRQWAEGPNYVGKILAVANALLLTQEASMAPTITKKITPVNFWAGRNGNPVEAVVIHVSEGGKAGVDSWFHNPASEASAHYLVNKDGTIWQFVEEADTAWANGKEQNPNLADPLVKKWHDAGINPNRRTIAIETERQWTERLTVPQLASLVWLCADLHRRYHLPTDGSSLLGHNEIDSVDRAHCPSLSAAEWSALVRGLAGVVPTPPIVIATQPTPPAPPADPATDGAVRWYLNADGAPVVEITYGGKASAIEGVAFAGDIGVSVRNAAGEKYHRTLRDGSFLTWDKTG